MATRDSLEDLVLLNLVAGVGTLTYKRLLEHFGSVREVLKANRSELQRVPGVGAKTAASIVQNCDPALAREEIERARDCDVRIVAFDDKAFPANLRMIYDPPMLLYMKGEIKEADSLAISVVGSRRCTYYGRSQAERFATSLGRMGFTIVSGMARGIDSAAHRGALNAGARTIAVFGCGLFHCYPPENKQLFHEIIHNGAVISEFPMTTPPDSRNFPRRNRIISGLSLGVIVVEAARRSGALITAEWALEQGRQVYAVPGHADTAVARGTHKLIQEGAKLATEVHDIVEELGPLSDIICTADGETVDDPRALALNTRENKIFSLVAKQPKDVDQIITESGMPAAAVSSTLMVLEIKKLIKQLSGRQFVRA